MLTLTLKKSILLLFMITVLILVSCKDDLLELDIYHFEADVIVFYQSGIKIGEIFRGITQDTLFARV